MEGLGVLFVSDSPPVWEPLYCVTFMVKYLFKNTASPPNPSGGHSLPQGKRLFGNWGPLPCGTHFQSTRLDRDKQTNKEEQGGCISRPVQIDYLPNTAFLLRFTQRKLYVRSMNTRHMLCWFGAI